MTVIDIKEVSKIMRVSVSHIRAMKDAPMFPRPLPYCKRPLLWSEDAIRGYLASLSANSLDVER